MLRTMAARVAARRSLLLPRWMGTGSKQQVTVEFVEDGESKFCTALEGTTLLEVAWDNDIELEGACDMTLCCSTCHVYIQEDYFDKLGMSEMEEEEEDMLELAGGLKDNSRLGCQVLLTSAMEGMRVEVPDMVTNNF
eukprot:TRINITY_DN6672_c0_g1_i1.p1 TRINITY_DN6672_c0_g1~~TRINITY_DN6672_c0_g1_i1.p1  ORF type:complete len:137 (+),score=45.42 TRINITY_DN6672_c0_g1_i1:47-457(+)